jgi:hypothetical protein
MKRACSLNRTTDDFLTFGYHPALTQNYLQMKKSVFLVLSILILCGLNAMAFNSVAYVRTADKIYFGQVVKVGIFKTKNHFR